MLFFRRPQCVSPAHCSYSTHSYLYFGQKGVLISSDQGSTAGWPTRALAILPYILEIAQGYKSEFCVFYLDDTTLGGPAEQVLADLVLVEEEARNLGLKLNHRKSELIHVSKDSWDRILSSFPSLKVIHQEDAILLGSPIGSMPALDAIIGSKIDKLWLLDQMPSSSWCFMLIEDCFHHPKATFPAPYNCFQSQLLSEFDSLQRFLL